MVLACRRLFVLEACEQYLGKIDLHTLYRRNSILLVFALCRLFIDMVHHTRVLSGETCRNQ